MAIVASWALTCSFVCIFPVLFSSICLWSMYLVSLFSVVSVFNYFVSSNFYDGPRTFGQLGIFIFVPSDKFGYSNHVLCSFFLDLFPFFILSFWFLLLLPWTPSDMPIVITVSELQVKLLICDRMASELNSYLSHCFVLFLTLGEI